jgi:two-component system, OmpR family, sensor histidine kinase KdpD
VSFASDVAIYLLIVVVTSIAGGFAPALAAAVAGSLLLNYFFTPPLHTFTVAEGQNALALLIFLLVAVLVSRIVHTARRVRPLAASDRARTALLNAVSHDLRTPIASAKAAVSSLRSRDVDWSAADRDELLASADASLDRLTDLVTNLLDLSRLQAGVLPVLAAPVDLGDVVSSALAHLAPTDARLDIDIADDLPEVIADAGLLERVIANLLQNALRFAPPGTPVRVTGTSADGRIELRVIDSGPGLAAWDQDMIFVPFQRAGDAPVPGAGIGLGLAIVRGFAEAMGGDVRAAQTAGGGTTMLVRLAPAADAS